MKQFEIHVNKLQLFKHIEYNPFVLNVKTGRRIMNEVWIFTDNKTKAIKWLNGMMLVYLGEDYKFILGVRTENYFEI